MSLGIGYRAFYVFKWAGSIAVCGAMSGEGSGEARDEPPATRREMVPDAILFGPLVIRMS